jgi:hypothetical protein
MAVGGGVSVGCGVVVAPGWAVGDGGIPALITTGSAVAVASLVMLSAMATEAGAEADGRQATRNEAARQMTNEYTGIRSLVKIIEQAGQ